jgi:hypothetical protein
MPKEHGQPVKRPTMSSLSSQITNSRPSAAPYHIPNQHSNNNNNQNKPGMPRMGVWPSKPNSAAPSKLNPALNSTAPRPAPAPPRADALTGADAVLYTNLGSSDPMDIMARMEWLISISISISTTLRLWLRLIWVYGFGLDIVCYTVLLYEYKLCRHILLLFFYLHLYILLFPYHPPTTLSIPIRQQSLLLL